MPCLVFLERFGEEEGSPVCQAADYAAVGEDKGAGCAGNSRAEEVLVVEEMQMEWRFGTGGKVLFDFDGGVWFAHADLSHLALFLRDTEEVHTTAIISYNMAPSSYLHRLRAQVEFDDGQFEFSLKAFAS